MLIGSLDLIADAEFGIYTFYAILVYLAGAYLIN